MFERVFKLSENKTNVKTEVMAGITTFMTMAYILAVNPSILGSTGMDTTAVLLATALASFVGTACMGLMANLPFALSAGMGLNAFMAYTVVAGYGYSWQVALLAVFIEGIIFIILSLTSVREAIFNAIPLTLKKAFRLVSACSLLLSACRTPACLWIPPRSSRSPALRRTSTPRASARCSRWWACSSPLCFTFTVSRAQSCLASC